MFCANSEQQLSTVDRLCLLADADREELEGGWAATFASDVFDRIDEEPFAVLFDERKGRPNAPVNVLVGALVLKELLGLTDEQLVGDIKWDLRLQYALRSTSFLTQPVSLRTLARFRVRVYRHYLDTGDDLIKQCVRSLAAHACGEMEIDGSVRRMDSMMVESSARTLSREELIYECVANLCRHLSRERPGLLTKRLERYADRDDLNRTFYHDKGTSRDKRTKRILADADALVALVGDDALAGDGAGEAKLGLLLRALEEQTVVDDAPATADASAAEAADAARSDTDTLGDTCGDAGKDGEDGTVCGVDDETTHDNGNPPDDRGDDPGNTSDSGSARYGADGAEAGASGDGANDNASCDNDNPQADEGGNAAITDGNEGALCGAKDTEDEDSDESVTVSTSCDNTDSSTDAGGNADVSSDNGSASCDANDTTDGDEEEPETNRRMRTKADGMPAGSNMLQSPHDPDSTFRRKAGRDHRGYAANFEESCGANGTIITNYQYGPNNTSDAEFLRQSLEDAEPVEGGAMLVTDGGYDGEDNIALAASKGIELVTTSLVGRDPADCLADFEWSEDGRSLLRCAAGHEPDRCGFYESSGQVRASFAAGTCKGCPFCDQCGTHCGKRVDSVTASPKSTRRARHLRRMRSEEFEAISRLRNGAETVPATMRRKYRIDDVPGGTVMGGIYVGLKVAAMNFRKLEDFRLGRGHCHANPLLGGRAS